MSIINFFEKINRKTEAEKILSSIDPNDGAAMHMSRQYQINFSICYNHYGMLHQPISLFTLDADDLEYFKNKYKEKLSQEMEEEIKQISDKYNQLIERK